VASLSPPLNLRGEKIENKALFYRETLIELTWEPNPLNDDVRKYKVYELDQGQNLLAELPANQFSYTVRNMDKATAYRFAVTAVDSQGLESEPSVTAVNSGTLVERSQRRGLKIALRRRP
jgi:fibronectin type 3 domain-containing protein